MTSTVASVTAQRGGGPQRVLARTSNGVLWAIAVDGNSSTVFRLFYSTDKGVTWNPGATWGSGSGQVSAHLFIDANDLIHVTYFDTDGQCYYRVFVPASTALTSYTAGGAAQLTSFANSIGNPSCVAIPSGPKTYVHVVATVSAGGIGNSSVDYAVLEVAADGTITQPAMQLSTVAEFTNVGTTIAAIDFAHTGDGKTPTASPDVFVAFIGGGQQVQYGRFAYGGVATWTAPSAWRTLTTSGGAAWLAGHYDGTAFVTVSVPPAGNFVNLIQRDRGDTITTVLGSASPALAGSGTAEGLAATWDIATGDVIVFASSSGSSPAQEPLWTRFSRATLTWSTWQVVEAATAQIGLSARAGDAGQGADVAYATGTGPYNVRFARIAVNNPPSAATWVNLDAQGADVAATLTLAWAFHDPDPGDTQGAWALSRQIGAGTVAYYRLSDHTWQATEQQNNTADGSVVLAAAWGASSDANHTYKVKTWDAALTAGVYSAALTVIPGAKVNPAVTAPTAGATVTTASTAVTWTCTDQAAYRVRVLALTGGSPTSTVFDTGWVTSTTTRTVTASGLLNGLAGRAEVTTRTAKGVQSDPITHDFTVTYVTPAVPVVFAQAVALIAGVAAAAVSLTIVDPAPSGGQPAVTSHDVYRSDGTTSIRVATAVPPNSTWIDRTPASGVAYTYRVVAFAANGTTSSS